jgi:glutamate synthase (NADPH/NADH) large chain
MNLLERLVWNSEHGACAIVANVSSDGRASHGNVKRTLEALTKMGHRTGEIGGEGDAQVSRRTLPREIWMRRIEEHGLTGSVVNHPYFTVAHILLPASGRSNHAEIKPPRDRNHRSARARNSP